MGKYEPVSLVRCDSYEYNVVRKALFESLSLIDGLSFVKPGMKVGIKTNLVSGMAPEKAATTHPVLLKVLSEMLLEKGATVVIGDSPGGLYTQNYVRGIYKACGLLELESYFADADNISEGPKVTLNSDFSIKNTAYPEAVSLKTFSYTGWIDEVDALINFSKLKTHAMMGMSCAVKNMFGTIPGATKPEYHMRFPEEIAFANLMVDLNEFFKPVLYVVDAIDGMEGNGPTAGEKRHIGAVIASKRPYALDMACAELIGMGINDCATLGVAFERGLGPKAVDEVEVMGSLPLSEAKIADFKRATIHQSITFAGNSVFSKAYSATLKLVCTTKPLVKKNECIGCKKCYETCPAKAITMVKGANKTGADGQLPSIDRSKCIKCFCCQEFCPVGAMKVHHNPLGKVLNKLNRQRLT
ncbi:MAG: DUF362 domain-containing protein [Butyrivibrio sp.]|nr:DUF362 domain-containing protein [Butyrivibrio sp.]